MSNSTKPEFNVFDITGKNYQSWILDIELKLQSMNLVDTIKENNTVTAQDKATAMIFIPRHLHESLKTQYLTVKDSLILWKILKDRYDHLKTVVLPRARYNWHHLRLQDYKSVADYNTALFYITSELELCGEKLTDTDLLEKTFSTFHASNVLLQQQYRERRFIKYSELISCLLVAEQNNELLLKNYELRPTGSSALPEANASSKRDHGSYQRHERQRGRRHGRNYPGRSSKKSSSQQNQKNIPHKWNVVEAKHDKGNKHVKNASNICHRCGMTGHWSRACRTSKHLVDLYQASMKEKEKKVEANFAYDFDPVDITHLDVSDFFEYSDGKIDHLIDDGHVHAD